MRIVLILAALVPFSSLLGCPKPSCTSNNDCLDGSFCTDGGDENGRFCARGCAADLACPAGQACIVRDDGSFEGACLEATDDITEGSACTGDRQCASGACLGEEGNRVCVAVCEIGGTCPDPDDLCTLEGLRHVCVPPLDTRAAGEVCNSPRECLSGTCVVRADALDEPAICAEECSDAIACAAADHVCIRLQGGARACLLPFGDGATCQANDACVGAFCVRDIDEKKKCATLCVDGACDEGFGCQTAADDAGHDLCLPVLDTRASGADCASARECASGHCAHFATTDEDFGTLCSDPCPSDGECAAPLVCWDDPAGTDVCGPAP